MLKSVDTMSRGIANLLVSKTCNDFCEMETIDEQELDLYNFRQELVKLEELTKQLTEKDTDIASQP